VQKDLIIQNATFAQVRSDINDNLQALATRAAGDVSTFPYMNSFDAARSVDRVRNGANDAWIDSLDFNLTGFGLLPQVKAKHKVFSFTGDNSVSTFTANLPTGLKRIEILIRASNLTPENSTGSMLRFSTPTRPAETFGQYLVRIKNQNLLIGSLPTITDTERQKELLLYSYNDRIETLIQNVTVTSLSPQRMVVQSEAFRNVFTPSETLSGELITRQAWSSPYTHTLDQLIFNNYLGTDGSGSVALPTTFNLDIYAEASD